MDKYYRMRYFFYSVIQFKILNGIFTMGIYNCLKKCRIDLYIINLRYELLYSSEIIFDPLTQNSFTITIVEQPTIQLFHSVRFQRLAHT